MIQFVAPSNLSLFTQKDEPIKLLDMISVEQLQKNGYTQSKSKRQSKKKKRKGTKHSSSKKKEFVSEIKVKEIAITNFEQSEDSTLDGDTISLGMDEQGPSSFSSPKNSFSKNRYKFLTLYSFTLIYMFLRNDAFDDELDTVFARAHIEFDSLMLRFTYCEALYGHGFFRAAMLLAKELSKELFQLCRCKELTTVDNIPITEG